MADETEQQTMATAPAEAKAPAKSKSKQQQQPEKERCWYVCDLLATRARTHSARDKDGDLLGRYTFQAMERKEMPWKHALAFVGIDGFEVRNEQGKKIRPRDTGGSDEIAQSLASDQVVANLTELTTEALAARCQALPGGRKYHSKAGKDAMMSFIIQGGDTDADPMVETEDGEVPGLIEMDPE